MYRYYEHFGLRNPKYSEEKTSKIIMFVFCLEKLNNRNPMKKVFYILTFFFTIIFANAQTDYELLVEYDVNNNFFSSTSLGYNTIFEGCTDTIIVTISKPNDIQSIPLDIPYQLAGDAVLGQHQDYQIFATSINGVIPMPLDSIISIPAGSLSVELKVLTRYDEHDEGTENIHLELQRLPLQVSMLLGIDIIPDTLILPIVDQAELNLNLTSDFSVYCAGDDAVIEAQLVGGVGGLMSESYPVDPYYYEWSQIGTAAIQTENPTETTEYCVEATDICGSQILNKCVTVTVPQYDSLEADLGITYICADIEGELCVDIDGGAGNNTFAWSNGSTDGCIFDYHDEYTLIVTDGCNEQDTASGEIYLDEAPDPFFEYLVIPHENLGMEFNNYTPAMLGLSYYWDFGDGYSYLKDPFHVFNESDIHDVRLEVTTAIAGCKKEYSDFVTVDPHYYFYVPNAFTPNDDAINDYFRPMVTGTRMYELFVYDSFGKLVFNTTDVSAEWDGTYNGKPAAEGTYVYKAVMSKELDVVIFEEQGVVNLIR